jgi:hypothetical protein
MALYIVMRNEEVRSTFRVKHLAFNVSRSAFRFLLLACFLMPGLQKIYGMRSPFFQLYDQVIRIYQFAYIIVHAGT